MFLSMARFIKEERRRLPIVGGVFTPGGLVGSGGAAAITALVDALRAVGIRFEVEEALHATDDSRTQLGVWGPPTAARSKL